MKFKTLLPALLVVLAAGCDSILDVRPINEVDEGTAITTAAGARAALAGLYDGLQSTGYYGGTFTFFGDLSAEDVEHTGTFTTYRQADLNALTADNTTIEGFWDALYRAVGRANIILARVPTVPGLAAAERDQMLAEARFARALTFHNLVKLWGEQAPVGMGVPIPLVPPTDIPTASQITRSTTGQVYTQILADLAAAESLMTLSGGGSTTHRATIGAVRAVRARVFLYQANYAAAEAEAEAVAAMGYTLAQNYAHLFTQDGQATPEDIFVLEFIPVDFQLLGFFYRAKGVPGGRREIGPTATLLRQYDPAYAGTPASYNPVDLRGQHNIAFTDTIAPFFVYGSKWPTGIGAEDVHVIRFAEVLLIKSEAEARQGKLAEADTGVNLVRARAGLPPVNSIALGQAAAIDSILQQRRLELVFEGDRWPDLVRTGKAAAYLAAFVPPLPPRAAFQVLYPIPLNELDVAPGLVQNTGY
ncbi:MAG: RagB/SusD family nutrient uptake outer membrane protein [Gemmatimonadales bacterium]